MRLPRVHTEHAEVQWVQLTHHAVVRYRARRRVPRGMDAADAAAGTLAEAFIERLPPAWAAGQEARWFAVTEDVCFPLVQTGEGTVWITTTCLVRGS